MSITNNMFAIMQKKNIKSIDLANHLHIRSSVVSTWKTRNTNPPSEYLIRICELLDVSIFELLGVDENTNQLTEDEQRLLKNFSDCTDEDRQMLLSISERLSR